MKMSEAQLRQLKRENILHRWGLTAEELTQIVDANPSMRGLMMGYVAEYKLRRMYFEDARITALIKDDDHDRKSKGDIRINYRGASFRIECKSLQTNLTKKHETGFAATYQCDASDSRIVRFSDGSEVKTTCLLTGEFDIVAVNLFALEEEWRFAFALNRDLPRSRYRKYAELQQRELIASSIKIAYPLEPPYVDDPFVLLDRLLDDASLR
ncbi:MAG: restriction endonuclease [Acidobacteria bacterium]|nr:restriction endonuclease [Acidobacteriota bacterium]